MTGCLIEPVSAPLSAPMTEVLAALHARCFADADGADWSATAMRTILAAPGACGWVAAASDMPCGLILARAAGDDCEILTFGVLPGSRRRGCGRLLMGEAARWASEAALVRLVLEVAVTSRAARAFYATCGFTEIGRRPDYYATSSGRIDALVLSAAPDRVLAKTVGPDFNNI
ncbi:MAG: GNAT family N-acetyltransferase [Alphaproteobacteria bacterium]|jgi:ribosomal protein S18 acetylase RimI-like enzyme